MDKDLLYTILPLIEHAIHLLHVLQSYSVREHRQRVDFILLYELQELLPILMYRGLAVANKAATCLHNCPNVEVICLVSPSAFFFFPGRMKAYITCVDSSDPNPSKWAGRGDHFIQDLRGVHLHSEE